LQLQTAYPAACKIYQPDESDNMTAAVPNHEKPPTALSAARMVETLRLARILHVIVVPDTYQETFIAAVAAARDIQMISACTEDEAVAINAGLYVTGHRPILSIQNNGLYACLNTIRGIALDGEVPTIMLIGQYGHKAEQRPQDSPLRMVRMLEPTLDTWDVPFVRLWSDDDLAKVPNAYEEAVNRRGPTALIVPIPTQA
jgi:sulfopyruvate decarboxylase TPP-binding subunit